MKKSILAVAVITAFTSSVQAASVKVYGRLDAGLTSISGTGANDETLSGLAYGPLSSSRWGIKGKEDLGGGYGAFSHWNQKFITIPGPQEETTRLEAESGTSTGREKVLLG